MLYSAVSIGITDGKRALQNLHFNAADFICLRQAGHVFSSPHPCGAAVCSDGVFAAAGINLQPSDGGRSPRGKSRQPSPSAVTTFPLFSS